VDMQKLDHYLNGLFVNFAIEITSAIIIVVNKSWNAPLIFPNYHFLKVESESIGILAYLGLLISNDELLTKSL
jgi:hypothetical protein